MASYHSYIWEIWKPQRSRRNLYEILLQLCFMITTSDLKLQNVSMLALAYLQECIRHVQSSMKMAFDHFFLGNMEFMGGDLDLPGSYLDAVKGCEGVFICALPETPR